VIPGVYAAGEVTGGFFYNNYPAGSSLTRCAVFGEIAGKNAAAFARRMK
jgi:tricarballylate dehydrogenase